MRRWPVICLCVLLCGSLLGRAEQPEVVQPDAAGYSAAQRAAFDQASQRLEQLLGNWDLGSQRRLGQGGWDVLDFAAFTAGVLERYGYRVAIVQDSDTSGVTSAWVLVVIDVGGGVAWVPVEPLRDRTGPQMTLGVVPWTAHGSLRFDARYVTYDSVVELPPNVPPVAVIRPPGGLIINGESVAWFAHTSFDPDGEIVLYRWTFVDEEPHTTTATSIWYTFSTAGVVTVTLTVTDNRGAQDSTAIEVEVEAEERPCGCG